MEKYLSLFHCTFVIYLVSLKSKSNFTIQLPFRMDFIDGKKQEKSCINYGGVKEATQGNVIKQWSSAFTLEFFRDFFCRLCICYRLGKHQNTFQCHLIRFVCHEFCFCLSTSTDSLWFFLTMARTLSIGLALSLAHPIVCLDFKCLRYISTFIHGTSCRLTALNTENC